MRLGDLTLRMLKAGAFRLDGGAMHGVVPRPLWVKLVDCDADNRILLSTNCLLVEREGGPGPRRILVETGNGAKWSDKQRAQFAMEPRSIVDALAEVGLSPDQIDLVVLTHLHFDHVGGCTRLDEDGRAVPVFSRARHVVQRGELASAHTANERNRGSYLLENIAPLEAAGLLDPVDGDVELCSGLRVVVTPGHTPHHQSVVVEGGGRSAIFFGDVIPTAVHLRLPWVMAYDVEPLVTVETKRRLLRRAREDHALVLFGHDSRHGGCLGSDARGEATLAQPIDLGTDEPPPC
jgi:glyoxylase-like metal-dependent hydrolase (beta-lactamase superfamily II)